MNELEVFLENREQSALNCLQPKCTKAVEKFETHCLETCFKS